MPYGAAGLPGNRSIVGMQVRLDDDLYTVAGVMPASFENVLAPAAELWAPLQYDSSLPFDGREWGPPSADDWAAAARRHGRAAQRASWR